MGVFIPLSEKLSLAEGIMAGLAMGVFGGTFFGLFMAGFFTFLWPERRLSTAGEAATAPGETFEVAYGKPMRHLSVIVTVLFILGGLYFLGGGIVFPVMIFGIDGTF